MLEENRPNSWESCQLDELVAYVTSGSRDWSKFYADKGANFIRTQDINKNKLNLSDVANVALPEKVEGKRTLVKKHDLLITITGANVGKCARVDFDIPESYVSQSVALVRLINGSYSEFLHKQIIAPVGEKTALQHAAYGMGRPVLNLTNIREFSVKLPPLAEQQEIARQLDSLLAQVDSIKTRLDAIPTIIKRFRQSVLAAAVSGKLTEEWRGEEAFAKHQGALQKFASIDVGHAFKSKEFSSEGIALLRGQNIEPGALKWSETKYFPENKLTDFAHLFIEDGDILLAMDRPIISSGLKLAKAKASDLPCVLVQRVARFKDFNLINDDYLYLLLKDVSFLNYIQPNQTGSDIPHISGKQILGFDVVLPSSDEQTEIVRRVEQLFAFADKIEQRVKDAQARVNNLTQSILAKAFRGELTAEWRELNQALITGENSAAALLKRIKTEREKLKPAKQTRARKKKS